MMHHLAKKKATGQPDHITAVIQSRSHKREISLIHDYRKLVDTAGVKQLFKFIMFEQLQQAKRTHGSTFYTIKV